MDNEALKRKIFRLHRNYSIGILVAIIVILFATHAADAPKLYENISFASTMSSLILSIIAIIYALQTSGTLAHSLNRIQKISKKLNKTSIKIEKTNINISKKIDLIHPELATVHKKLDSSQEALENLIFSEKDAKDQGTNLNQELSEELVKAYVNRANHSLLDILMICTLIHKEKLKVNFNQLIISKNSDLFLGLAIGTLQTVISLKLVKFKKTVTKDNEIFVEFVNVNKSLLSLVEEKYAETYRADRDDHDEEDIEDTGYNLPLDCDGRMRKLTEIIYEYSL